MHQYERQAKFVEQIRTITSMPRHTVREDDLWYIAKDLHKYLCQLDEGNLQAFNSNLFSIIDLANMYAEHAGGLRTFHKDPRPYLDAMDLKEDA